jgi:hypothetical protein
MAQNSRKSFRIKRKFSQADYLTMMIVGKKGNVRTFRVSFRFLFWTSVLLALYILASIFIFCEYLDERRINSAHLTEFKSLQHEIKETKRTLDRSKHHLALLKNSIQDIGIQRKVPAESVSPAETADSQSAPSEVERKSIEKKEIQPVEKVESIPQEQFVDIKDLAIKKEGKKLTIRFKLVNMYKDKRPIDGYVHIIAFGKNSDPPLFLAFPEVALKDGIPVEFKRGQPFFIKRFKTIRGKYLLDTGTGSVSSIKVLVYNKSGTVIFQKEFEVENIS